jgi:glycerol uptake facilitator-like aquaporin
VRRQRLPAEATGTFFPEFIGPGAAAVNRWSGGVVTAVGIALAFGFVILAGVYALGHISGAQFNPAVTAGFWWSGRFPRSEVAPYWAAQFAGATAAALLVRMLLGPAADAMATQTILPATASLITEVVVSFFLVLVVMAGTTDARVGGPVAGLAVITYNFLRKGSAHDSRTPA